MKRARLILAASLFPLSGCFLLLNFGDYDLSPGSIIEEGGSSDATNVFTLALTPAHLTIAHGTSGSVHVDVTRTEGNLPIDLSIAPPLPAGVTVPSVTIPAGGTTADLTVNVDVTAALGDAALTVSGTTGNANASSPLTLTVVQGGPGELDPSFGENGVVTSTVDGVGLSALLLSDGKIIASGYRDGSSDAAKIPEMVIARFLPSGLLDSSFGNAGVVVTFVPDPADAGFRSGTGANAIALDTSGRIIAAGAAAEYAVTARYFGDGSVDPSFGGGGMAFDPGVQGSTGVHTEEVAIAMQNDNIVVGSQIYIGFSPLVRFDSTGAVDPTFTGKGLDASAPPYSADMCGVIVRSDGSLMQCGFGSGAPAIYFDHYTAGGAFLEHVIPGAARPPSTKRRVRGVLTRSDDTMLAFGSMCSTSDYYETYLFGDTLPLSSQLTLDRISPDGGIDPTFADAGGLVLGNAPSATEACGAAYDTTGRIVVGGAISKGAETSRSMLVMRFMPDGTTDPTFQSTGSALGTIVNIGGDSQARAVLIQPDGRIVAVGNGTVGSKQVFALARFLP